MASQKRASGTLTTYLIAYNALSAAAWAAVLAQTLAASAGAGTGAVPAATAGLVRAVQTTAVAEVAHAVCGLVRADAGLTALQIASRLLLVWGVATPWPSVVAGAAHGAAYAVMLLAWSATEIIRYGYFAVARATSNPAAVPAWLVWLRYSAFLLLYPIGISCECFLIWRAVPEARILAPALAWAFYAILLAYVPGSYVLYSHMLRQRRKVLGRPKEKL